MLCMQVFLRLPPAAESGATAGGKTLAYAASWWSADQVSITLLLAGMPRVAFWCSLVMDAIARVLLQPLVVKTMPFAVARLGGQCTAACRKELRMLRHGCNEWAVKW